MPSERCKVCGQERANVEPATLSPWPATEVEACPVCRYFYDDDRDDCLTCGGEPAHNYVEIEADVGDVEMPGCVSGALCDDCASHFVAEITQNGRSIPTDVLVAADPDLTAADLEAGCFE